MEETRPKKSLWRQALWVTRVAALLGAVCIGVGIIAPRFFQIKILGCVALASIALSLAAIAMLLWRPDRRSRRFRDNRFWIALAVNLILIVVVLRLYIRGSQLPVFQHEDKQLPNTPEPP